MTADDDLVAVRLRLAQWKRAMQVLGDAKNDVIAGDIALELNRTSPISGSNLQA